MPDKQGRPSQQCIAAEKSGLFRISLLGHFTPDGMVAAPSYRIARFNLEHCGGVLLAFKEFRAPSA